jgi:hypothetical protein
MVRIPLPPNVTEASAPVDPYDVDSDFVVDEPDAGSRRAAYWRIDRVQGGARPAIRMRLRLAGANGTEVTDELVQQTVASIGLLELHFSIPMLQCSRVALKNVRLYDSGKSNEDACRWLRYNTDSGHYAVRT